MLYLFRKIRRSLIASKNTRRYILYAFGEILLIVLGILIALQISNWNESAKRKELEEKSLLEIRNEMLVTRDEIQIDLDNHVSEMEDMKTVMDHMIQKKSISPQFWLSFINATRDHQAYPKTSAFENLKSIGLDIIRNDTLRREITQFYQLSLERIIDRGDYSPKYDIETAFQPYLDKYLDVDENNFQEWKIPGEEISMNLYFGKIKEYTDLIIDRSLLRELQSQMRVRFNKIRLHYDTIEYLDEIVEMINRQLKISE